MASQGQPPEVATVVAAADRRHSTRHGHLLGASLAPGDPRILNSRGDEAAHGRIGGSTRVREGLVSRVNLPKQCLKILVYLGALAARVGDTHPGCRPATHR